MILSYNDFKNEFEKHNCILLMTEEEFNVKPRTTNEKYKYIAQCDHNHEIRFRDFKNQLQGFICRNCSKIQFSINNKSKLKYKEVKDEFEKHNCKLLMTEDEFNKKTRRTVSEKYNYTAQCGHNHEVTLTSFKDKLSGLICPKCVILDRSIKYNDMKEEFEKHNCELLMTEEEFDLKPRKISEKYNYTASCGHNNEVRFGAFKYNSSGIICPNCVLLQDSIIKKEKYRLNPVLSNDLEYNNILYLITLVAETFDVKFNYEGCLADCCIKPKNVIEDSWLRIQMKTTSKPTSSRYQFGCSNRYINCLIMCICDSDKKMWIFDGNKMTINGISITLIKSKYNDFEITTNTILLEKITHFYNTLPKDEFEIIDIPINPDQKLEKEYRKYRETMIYCISFTNHERHGLVYDFMINGFFIQEKVCSKMKNRNYTRFSLYLFKLYNNYMDTKHIK